MGEQSLWAYQHAKNVRSIADLARAFNLGARNLDRKIKEQNEIVGKKVVETAKEKFGYYQPSIGEFPSWKRLVHTTIAEKLEAGGAEDPLIGYYKPGHEPAYPKKLKDSITSHVDGLKVMIGTDNPLGDIHEYGAPAANIPPRPFLRPALWQNKEFIRTRMQLAWANTVALIARSIPPI